MGGMSGMRQVGTGHLVRRLHVSSVVGCVLIWCVCAVSKERRVCSYLLAWIGEKTGKSTE